VSAFQQDTHLKNLMNTMFVHAHIQI